MLISNCSISPAIRNPGCGKLISDPFNVPCGTWTSNHSYSITYTNDQCAKPSPPACVQFALGVCKLSFSPLQLSPPPQVGGTMVIKTESCRFSGLRIYPGHGMTMIRVDSQVFKFLSSKTKRLFNLRWEHWSHETWRGLKALRLDFRSHVKSNEYRMLFFLVLFCVWRCSYTSTKLVLLSGP